MNWRQNIVNAEVLPSGLIEVHIQHGKAMYRAEASAFAHTSRVLGFETKEQAQHFIDNWDFNKMYDYKQACLKDDYTFWVFDKMRTGEYYADDIRMTKDYERTI
jgi:hypothetical protein